MALWQSFDVPACFPTCSCEALGVAQAVRQPHAFWSSLGYGVVALLFLYRWKRAEGEAWFWILGLWGVMLASLLAHASFTLWFLAADIASIIGLFGFIPLAQLTTKLTRRQQAAFYFVALGLLTFLIRLLPMESWVLATSLLFSALWANLMRQSWGKRSFTARDLALCGLFYVLGFALFLFDREPWPCQMLPLYPHTLWHLCGATSGAFFGRWYFSRI